MGTIGVTPALETAITGGVNIFLKYYDIQRQNQLIDQQIEAQEKLLNFLEEQNKVAMAPLPANDYQSLASGELSGEEPQAIHPTPKYNYEFLPAKTEEAINSVWEDITNKVKDPVLLGELKKWYSGFTAKLKQSVDATVLKYDQQRTLLELDKTANKIVAARTIPKEQKIAQINSLIDKQAATGLLGDFQSVEKIKQNYAYKIEQGDVVNTINALFTQVKDSFVTPEALKNHKGVLATAESQAMKYIESSNLLDKDKNALKSMVKQFVSDTNNVAQGIYYARVNSVMNKYETSIVQGNIATRQQLNIVFAQDPDSAYLDDSDRRILYNFIKEQTGEGSVKTPPYVFNTLIQLATTPIPVEEKMKIYNDYLNQNLLSPSDARFFLNLLPSSNKINNLIQRDSEFQSAYRTLKKDLQTTNKSNKNIDVNSELQNFANAYYKWVWDSGFIKIGPKTGTVKEAIPPDQKMNWLRTQIEKTKINANVKGVAKAVEGKSVPFVGQIKNLLSPAGIYMKSAQSLVKNKEIYEELANELAQKFYNAIDYKSLNDQQKQYINNVASYMEGVRMTNKAFLEAFHNVDPENMEIGVDQRTGAILVYANNIPYTVLNNKGEYVWATGRAVNGKLIFTPTQKIVEPSMIRSMAENVKKLFSNFTIQSILPPNTKGKGSPKNNKKQSSPFTPTPNPQNILNIDTNKVLQESKKNQ